MPSQYNRLAAGRNLSLQAAKPTRLPAGMKFTRYDRERNAAACRSRAQGRDLHVTSKHIPAPSQTAGGLVAGPWVFSLKQYFLLCTVISVTHPVLGLNNSHGSGPSANTALWLVLSLKLAPMPPPPSREAARLHLLGKGFQPRRRLSGGLLVPGTPTPSLLPREEELLLLLIVILTAGHSRSIDRISPPPAR
jgi:hypothetical protein